MLTIRGVAIAGVAAGVYALAANPSFAGSAFGNTPALSIQESPIQQRLSELQAESVRLARERRTLLNELRRLQVDRELKAAELEARTVALEDAAAALAALEAEEAALGDTLARQAPLVRARVVELYKRGRASDLRRLADAASARDAMRAWRQMAAASRRDAARFAEHRAALEALAASRVELAARRQDAERLRVEASAARASLDRSIRRHEQRLDAVARERELNAELTAEIEAAAAGLAAAVEALPDAASPASGAAPLAAMRRALPWPAAGRVVRPFRADTRGGLPFNGVEIAVAAGADVAAVHDGDVAFSGPFTGFGHLIILQHGPESFTLYGHLAAGHVGTGERVTAGQVIGRAGPPPGARDSRLYFELRVDGQPVDPLQWLRSP